MIWLILVCMNCDIEAARAADWRAQAVLEAPLSQWRRPYQRTFASRRECLRALRRDEPEGESYDRETDQATNVVHHPDHVETFQAIPLVQSGTQYAACFRAPIS